MSQRVGLWIALVLTAGLAGCAGGSPSTNPAGGAQRQLAPIPPVPAPPVHAPIDK